MQPSGLTRGGRSSLSRIQGAPCAACSMRLDSQSPARRSRPRTCNWGQLPPCTPFIPSSATHFTMTALYMYVYTRAQPCRWPSVTLARLCVSQAAPGNDTPAFDFLVNQLQQENIEQFRPLFLALVQRLRPMFSTLEPYVRPTQSRGIHPFIQRDLPEVTRDKNSRPGHPRSFPYQRTSLWHLQSCARRHILLQIPKQPKNCPRTCALQ